MAPSATTTAPKPYVASALLIGNALSILVGWASLIITNPEFELSFHCRDPESQWLMWPHWLAEFTSAVCAVVAGLLLLFDQQHPRRGRDVALFASGALCYTSLNSLSWALAERDRLVYAFFMVLGLLSYIFVAVSLLLERSRPITTMAPKNTAKNK
jgi:hypothetical protein